MNKKILFLMLATAMLIGAVAAADQDSFKVPSNFEDLGDGVYVLYDAARNTDEILSVVKYNEHDWKDYTTNDTDNKYVVVKDENNTYNYTDGSVDEVGSFELVEVGGDKYIIDFSKIGSDNGFSQTYGNLMDFNNLNKLKAIEK